MMFYFHREGVTRSKKWRSAIIVVEILVLVLAVFFNNFRERSPVESLVHIAVSEANPIQETVSVASNTDGSLHGLAFYVDYKNRVRVVDGGVMTEFAQFEDCTLQLLRSQDDDILSASRPETAVVYLNLATIREGITFYAKSYEVVVTDTTVTLITSNIGSFQFAIDCRD